MTGFEAHRLSESQRLQQLHEFKLDEKSKKRILDGFTPRFTARYITAVSDESNEDEDGPEWWPAMPRDVLKCLGHAIAIQMRSTISQIRARHRSNSTRRPR
jgi:hypothetical protein